MRLFTNKRTLLAMAAGALVALSLPAAAQQAQKITIGYTGANDFLRAGSTISDRATSGISA